jgi:hypothetical protein
VASPTALPQDWLDFIDAFLAREVEFVIVGAFALAYHQLPRATGDIDFFVSHTLENAQRIIEALNDFGFGSLGVKAEDFSRPDHFMMLGRPPVRIDVLTSIDGITFEEAYRDRVYGDLDGREVPFRSFEHLVKNKESTGRLKDKADVEKLRRLRPDGTA